MSDRPAVMVINPAADGGRTGRVRDRLLWEARRIGLELELLVTTSPGEATELTRQALSAGARLVVAVGGDGTVSDVANGFLDADGTAPVDADLAVLPRGSGCDFVRSFGIPRRTARALEVAARGSVRTIDAGRISFTGHDGRPATRFFVNVASAGLTATAADLVNRGGKPLGATVAYAWGGIRAFTRYRNTRMHVELDDRRRDLIANNVIVGNCGRYASGMRILPDAQPDDGEFDVLVWGDVSRGDLLRTLHKLYRGTHTDHPQAEFSRARRVAVDPERPLPVEADGETPGMTPAVFEIVPAALRLRVPAR